MKGFPSIKKLWLLFIAGLGWMNVNAQLPDYHLQLFDYTSGIQPGTISSVAKDKLGTLWILYRRQVQRFDGKRIQTFRPDQLVDHLYCDESGRIWLSSSKNVFLFSEEEGNFKKVKVLSGKGNFQPGPIQEVAGEGIWLMANNGIYAYDSLQQEFKPVLADMPVPLNYHTRLFAIKGKTIFLNHGRWIYRYNWATKKTDSLNGMDLNKIFALSEDSVLISTWKNDSYWVNFNNKSITAARPPRHLMEKYNSSFNARSMIEFAANRFFITALEGIFEYNNLTQTFKRLQFFLNGNKVSTNDYANWVYMDRDGYGWLATVDGVARFSIVHQPIGLLRISQLYENLPHAINNIRRLIQDKEGNLWLGTGYGFVKWKKEKNEWKFYLPVQGSKTKLAHPSIRGLAYDGKYLILGPTDLGLWLFDPESEQYKRPFYESAETRRLSEQDFVSDIITLKNGDHLIAARDAVYVLNGRTYQLRKLPGLPAKGERANFGLADSQGIVWVTTSNGLYCLDSTLTVNHRVKLLSDNQFIRSGFIMKDNRLLFATDDGLYTATCINKDSTTVKKMTSLFDQVAVLTIYQDKKGIIWVCSENGIFRYDPESAKIYLFDHSDHVQGYGFNGNSWFRDKEGTLFFGGINGLNYLNPESFVIPDESLPVYIRQVRVGKKDSVIYGFNGTKNIPYADRTIEVEFAAAYYNNPGKVLYRYQLEGLDNQWKSLGDNNTVRFSSLPPGSYTLKVQASLNQVNWVDGRNSFSFKILPAFYMTWWFITGCLLLLMLGIWSLLHNRNKQLAEKQEELDTEQAINYFASSIYETNSVKAILWDVVKNCIGRLHFDDCVIYLLDQERKVLIQRAAYGPKSPESFTIKEPLEIPLGKGITGSVALTGKAEIVADTSKDDRYIVDLERRYAEICVPIVSNGKVLGVIDCEHSKKGFFTQKHLSILTTIASLCGNKIVKAKAEAEKAKAEAILMDTQQKMADVEMQALRAQMNPHFIFNCLNSINRYIVKSDQATASLYLTRFAKLIRLILDNSNSKTVTLSNELDALRLYIEMESIRFEKQFTYLIKIEEGIQADRIYVPPLIIQPYVENAIWHGLLHKETAGHLLIFVKKKSSGMLECIIEDNGVGREKAKTLRSKSASTRKSLGMKLTEDRLALLNRQSMVKSTVEVEDIEAAAGEPGGTRVIVSIPIDAE